MKKKILPFLIKARGLLMIIAASAGICDSIAQQAPYNPVSYRIYHPFIFNPAIAGSKDYASAGFIFSNKENDNSQILSFNARVSKKADQYLTSVPSTRFTKLGLGAYMFNENINITNNLGLGLTSSYHLRMNRNELSFLSFGLSVKAIVNRYPGNTDLPNPPTDTFIPDIDLGIYYYSPVFYAGLSATNLMDTPANPDSLGIYTIPVSRQYFLTMGYRIVLSKSMQIVAEPFLLVNTGDDIPDDPLEMLKPGLKTYFGDICIGSYFNDFKRFSFFGQFNYRRIFLATYFEIPYRKAYYQQAMLVEFAAGINISALAHGNQRKNHW